MQVNELELLMEYTRAQKGLDEIVIEVASIEWQGPHECVTTWQPVTHISIDSNAHQIIAARLNALKRKRYFLVYIECGFRCAVGHMHNADMQAKSMGWCINFNFYYKEYVMTYCDKSSHLSKLVRIIDRISHSHTQGSLALLAEGSL